MGEKDPKISTEHIDNAHDIVETQQGDEAAADPAHVAEVAGKLAALEGLYQQREQRLQDEQDK